ncbi:MAG: hypothetical protein JOZ36_02780 [Acidobacteria bacterium]|nr:hypothetical protein [Acidobacteriota bacterium]
MKDSKILGWDEEMRLVSAAASVVALLFFAFYLRHDSVLRYGDAVAHINIARRVFDSKTPGVLQLGTVWLPLPHLLMIPFLVSKAAWESGAGGSVPSLVAYVFAVLGIFRLVRGSLSLLPGVASRTAAYLAAIILGANPNLIYLSTTAMTEPLYLALFIWAVLYFCEFIQGFDTGRRSAASSLEKCALCLACAEWTRYDGWLLAIVVSIAVTILVHVARGYGQNEATLGRALRNFVLIVAAAPTVWLAYNWAIYRNPLEFATGPYSAREIEKRSATPGFPAHPGSHDVIAAGEYFLKAAEDNLSGASFERGWLGIAILGSALSLLLDRRLAAFWLLWLPFPFYALSIAYGGVPVFVPSWWPFSYYNVRYGIELLPAAAVFFSVGIYFLSSMVDRRPAKALIVVLAMAWVAASYVSVWRAQPVTLREAWVNSQSRIALERELAANLHRLPAKSTLLMYLGDHVGALQAAGIPLARVIQEGNHRTWRQPSDPAGLWERALADPGALADYAIGFDDDPVARSARRHKLVPLIIVETPGQRPATIFSTHTLARE